MASELGLRWVSVESWLCPAVPSCRRLSALECRKYRDVWADTSVEESNLSKNETGGVPA